MAGPPAKPPPAGKQAAAATDGLPDLDGAAPTTARVRVLTDRFRQQMDQAATSKGDDAYRLLAEAIRRMLRDG